MKIRVLSVLLSVLLSFGVILSGCNDGVRNLSEDIATNDFGEINGIKICSESYWHFSQRLLFDCFEEKGKSNTLVSPLSVALAFAMVAEGAEGETLEEIENTLGMDINELRELFYEDNSQLSIANSMWVNSSEGFTVNEDFLERNAQYHKAEIFEAPFNRHTLEDINSWVSDKTDGMIEKIIDQLDERAVMCLVNSLLFDAKWNTPYSEYDVDQGYFVTEENVPLAVEFLSGMEGYYLEDEIATGFLKYYENCKYAFAAMLPNEGVSVEEYLMSLNAEKVLGNMQACSVSTRLPKFESEFDVSLENVLKNMGMEKAFDEEKADFSKLGTVKNGNIYIGDAVHKTKISVTEQGTKAGAATAVTLFGAGAPQEVKEVYLDRPFVYMIVDMENNIPVFMGTLMNL